MMRLTQNRVAASGVLALGVLLALIAAFMLQAAKPAYASSTFTVTNTSNSGAGSLRQAILDANATTTEDMIQFNIPGSGVKTIAPATELPQITSPVTIDGYTQPGAQPNTKAVGSDAVLKVELSGASAPSGTGLYIVAANSTVKGLVINRWDMGIILGASNATGNRVVGNYIGTDASGTQALQNDFDGVYIGNASNNTIGGVTAAERNVISGNYYYGVHMDGLAAKGNKVVGNYLGTDASGTRDLGNRFAGVYSYKGPDNTIGGTTAAERNVISANDNYGVLIYGTDATGNKVTGNYVGADATGRQALGNDSDGVYIGEAPNTTIGGATVGGRNVISANSGDGVYITGSSATGNRVLQNSIYANGGLGIDLGSDGPTPNDPGDADAGPNDLQNKPILSSAKTSATSTTVRGTLNSTSGKTIVVRFFSNPSGTDEGKTFIGQKSVTSDASGNASFTFSPAQKVGLGQTVTATATSQAGNTSEFSAARTVVAP
jgi:hypothetical protein